MDHVLVLTSVAGLKTGLVLDVFEDLKLIFAQSWT